MSPPFFNPVGLTSIERLHYFDSDDDFSNRISCRLAVNQVIDFDLGRQACFWLAERHPVLGCSIEKMGGRLSWLHDSKLYQIPADGQEAPPKENDPTLPWFHVEQLGSEPDSLPDFQALLSKVEFYRPCIVIRQWPTYDADKQQQTVTSEIWLSIHHCFCDGAGGIQIISDWVQIYENLSLGLIPTAGLPELDQKRFKFRNRLGLGRWKYLRLLPFQAIGLFGATKFVFRKSIQVHKGQQIRLDQGRATSNSSIVSSWISAEDWSAIEQACQAADVNCNAKLLGDLFSTLQFWFLKANPQANSKQWVRIILPINLRDIGDRRLSAANRSSLIQIDRRNLQAGASTDLYRSIQREIGIVLRFQLDRMFLIMVRLIGLSDGILKRVVRNQKPRGIAVFTNLGRPFRRIEKRLGASDIDDRKKLLDLRELDFLAPLRFGTPFNFSLAQFKERLRVTLHFDAILFSRAEAEQLLNEYVEAIRAKPKSPIEARNA